MNLTQTACPLRFAHSRRTEEFKASALPHMNDIYRTAIRMLGNGSAAEDVLQDVYLQAWKSFHQFELGTNCRAWLFKILFHTLRHYRRKWVCSRIVQECEEILAWTAACGPPLPEHITDEEMLAALTETPQDFRAVVILIDVEEFSYKEAARILNIPIGTVMSRLSRGRRLLREKLADFAQSYGIGRRQVECQSAAQFHARGRLRTRLKAAVNAQDVPPELTIRIREQIRRSRAVDAGWYATAEDHLVE